MALALEHGHGAGHDHAVAHHAPPSDSPGTWRKGEFVLIGDVFVPVLASLVWLGLLYIVLAQAMQDGALRIELRDMLPTFGRTPVTRQILTASSDLVLLFFVWRVARRVAGSSLVARWRPTRRFTVVAALLGGAALALATRIGMDFLVSNSIIKLHPNPGERIFVPGTPYQVPLVIATVVLIAPFVEEFYFRGVLLSWLKRKITAVPAAIASAAIFALLHFRFAAHPGLEGWIPTGIIATVGLVNATLALRTRSLWPPFCFHAGYNLMLLVPSLVPPGHG